MTNKIYHCVHRCAFANGYTYNGQPIMSDALVVEYWCERVPPEQRIIRWLEKADALATGWIPSKSLFLEK